MKKLKKVLLGLLFFAKIPLNAVIHETDNLADLLEICEQDWLVIVDLDNTLIRALTKEATDEWFRAETENLTRSGMPKRAVWDLVLPTYTKAQCETKIRFVENCAPRVLDALRVRQIQTIVLTARGRPELVDATFRQFADLGITFVQGNPLWQKIFTLAPLRGETLYKDGVIFCDGNNKGMCLARVFEQVGRQPSTILMIDDARENLEVVEEFSRQHGIKFIGLHYLRVKHGLLDIPTQSDESSMPSMQPETAAQ